MYLGRPTKTETYSKDFQRIGYINKQADMNADSLVEQF